MKVLTAREAAELLEDNSTIAVSGFGAYSVPDELLAGVEQRYAEKKHPSHITVFSTICTGDFKKDRLGHNHLSGDGLIDTIIAAHFRNSDEMDRLVGENKIAGYTLPLGVNLNLLQAAASKKPGVLTSIGIGTYIDPRIEGCAVNDKAKAQHRELVSVVHQDDQDYLFYRTVPIDVCLIRGTYADEDGNISLRNEAIVEAQLEMAMAAKSNGGTVIVQVEKIISRGTIPAKEVLIHRSLVDYVVVASPENHLQSYAVTHDHPELTGDLRVPSDAITPMPLSLRKVIARRAAMELKPNSVINLGIGIPSGVGSVANEEGLASGATLSLESGPLGGVPAEGIGFGGSTNPEAINHISDNFNFYDGGGLNMAFLGIAEVDENGDVNVSRFGTRCAGPGGFINITQRTPAVCFMGGFTAEKPELQIGSGQLKIIRDGKGIKFVKKVRQITFSADYARKTRQRILYITERAVFQLVDDGLLLIEVAPGVDVEKDVLAHMDFRPKVAEDLRQMDPRLFCPEKMGLHF